MSSRGASQAGHAQTPAELLAKLTSHADDDRPDAGFLKSVADITADRLDIPPERRAEILSSLSTDRLSAPLQARLQDLLVRFPPDLRARLGDEEFCMLGLIWTREVNARALLAANGGWLIVINEGLLAFVYKFARTLMIRLPVADSPGGGPPGGPVRYGARLMSIVLDWYASTGTPAGPDFPATPMQLRLASALASAAENFVLGHELAHQALGHTQRAVKSLLVNTTPVRAAAVSPQDEHDADTWGMRFIFDSLEGQPGEEWAIAYAGMELFFAAAGLLETHAGTPPGDTHPPAATRLATVRAYVGAIVSAADLVNLKRTWNEIAEWVDDLRAALANPSAHWTGLGDAELRTQFEHLLEGSVSLDDDMRALSIQGARTRMWDVPAAVFCDQVAERLATAYRQRDARTVDLLVSNLLRTGPLRRAVDERLPVPFLWELNVGTG